MTKQEKKVHFKTSMKGVSLPSCCKVLYVRTIRPDINLTELEADPAKITCKACRNTKVWKAAWDEIDKRCFTCGLGTTKCEFAGNECTSPNASKWQPIPPTPEVKSCEGCMYELGGGCVDFDKAAGCGEHRINWELPPTEETLPSTPAKVIEFKSVFTEPPSCCSCELPIVGVHVENTIGNIICEPCLRAGMKALTLKRE